MKTMMTVALLTTLVGSTNLLAQEKNPRRESRQQQRPTSAQMQERMMKAIQKKLEFTDEIWTVVKPLVVDVLQKQRATRGADIRGLMQGRRGGRPDRGDDGASGDRGDRPDRGGNEDAGRGGPPRDHEEESTAMKNLRTALENKTTSSEELQKKIQAYRDFINKANGELKVSREKLRQVLNARQEATLITFGLLD